MTPHRTAAWRHERRVRLKMVVGLKSTTMAHFARKLGVSLTHLNLVLRGKRISDRLDAAVYSEILWGFGPTIAERFKP